MKPSEHVVLVDDNNHPLGTAPKSTVHTDQTPLHRAFSVFLFNSQGQLLLQQRSKQKKTWPLVWSNSCCGHPALDESTEDAIRRRMQYELGLDEAELHEILPDFRYRAERDGVVENEICPVWIGFISTQPKPNPEEVETCDWTPWENFLSEVQSGEGKHSPFSEWSIEEALLLEKNEKFQKLFSSSFQI